MTLTQGWGYRELTVQSDNLGRSHVRLCRREGVFCVEYSSKWVTGVDLKRVGEM